MVVTVLEADVVPEREADLRREYEATAHGPLPSFIVRSSLVRSVDVPTRWRIMTVFRSRADLEQMRSSGETPRGVMIFRAAGAEPSLRIFDVVDQFENEDAS